METSPSDQREAGGEELAREQFEAGSKAFDREDFEAALEHFRRSEVELARSGAAGGAEHCTVLNAIAASLAQLGRFEEASATLRGVVGLLEAAGSPVEMRLAHLADLLVLQRAVFDPAAAGTAERIVELTRQEAPGGSSELEARLELAGTWLELSRPSKAVAEYREALAAVPPGLEEEVELRAALNQGLAKALFQTGEQASALKLLREVVVDRKLNLGCAVPGTLQAMRELAEMLEDLGSRDEADAMLRQVSQFATRAFENRVWEELQCRSLGARFLLGRGECRAAAEMLEVLAREHETALGPRHGETLAVLLTLGRSWYDAGELARAEEVERRVVDALREKLGDGHSRTLQAKLSLATTLDDRGRRAEAQRLIQEVGSTLAERSVHPSLKLAYLTNLARTGWSKNLVEEMRAGLLEVQEHVGPADPSVVDVMEQLASTLATKGRAEGRDWSLRALRAVESRANAREQDRLVARTKHAQVLLHLGELEEAWSIASLASRRAEELLGSTHPQTLGIKGLCGLLLVKRGEYWEGAELIRSLYAAALPERGREHPEQLMLATNYATACLGSGNPEAAESLLRWSFSTAEGTLGAEHPLTLEVGVSFCAALAMAGARGRREAIEVVARLTPALERVFGEDDPRILMLLVISAEVRAMQNELEGAVAGQRSVIERATALHGVRHPTTIMAMISLGAMLLRKDEPGAAGEVLERAIDAVRGTFGSDHLQILIARALLGVVQCRLGLVERAEAALSEVLARGEQRRATAGGEVARAQASDAMVLDSVAFVLSAAQIRLGRGAADVIASLERGSARAVFDLMDRAPHDWEALGRSRVERGRWSPAAFAAFKDALNRATDAEKRLAAAEDARTRAARKADLDEARAALTPFHRELISGAQPRGLAEIRGTLRQGEVLLLFGWSGLGVTMAAVSADGETTCRVLSENPDDIERASDAADELRAALMGEAPRADRAALSAELLAFLLPASVRPQLARASAVLVAASGPLHELPLDAVAELGGLAELAGKPVISIISGSVLAMLRGRTLGRGKGAAVVGDPRRGRAAAQQVRSSDAMEAALTRSEALAPLPRARSEARDVGDLLAADAGGPVTVLVGEEATPRALWACAEGVRYLHVAAHAVLGSRTAPLSSAVMLADEGAGRRDAVHARLQVDTLLTRWAGRLSGCELVALSCCRTGNGVAIGDSVLALPMAFLYAGAACVLATLWKVDDTAAWLLMRRFYQNLTVGAPGACTPMPIAAALLEAKRWLRELPRRELFRELQANPLPRGEEFADAWTRQSNFAAHAARFERPFEHPRYWAAFTLIGNPTA